MVQSGHQRHRRGHQSGQRLRYVDQCRRCHVRPPDRRVRRPPRGGGPRGAPVDSRDVCSQGAATAVRVTRKVACSDRYVLCPQATLGQGTRAPPGAAGDHRSTVRPHSCLPHPQATSWHYGAASRRHSSCMPDGMRQPRSRSGDLGAGLTVQYWPGWSVIAIRSARDGSAFRCRLHRAHCRHYRIYTRQNRNPQVRRVRSHVMRESTVPEVISQNVPGR